MRNSVILAFVIWALGSTISAATPLSFWSSDDWRQFADDDGVGNGGFVNPGWGGQDFDAEYLYYKFDNGILSLGLQTGFDIIDGHVPYGSYSYYAGDLALSFDNDVTLGDSSTYEYAVDFGLLTKNNSGNTVDAGTGTGIDVAGLYSVSAWNNDISFVSSAPFAMDAGSLVAALLSNNAGQEGDSYYRTVSFDVAALGLSSPFGLDAHWTMSCGNDAIDGHVIVPEPKAAPLLLIALSLAWLILPPLNRHNS